MAENLPKGVNPVEVQNDQAQNTDTLVTGTQYVNATPTPGLFSPEHPRRTTDLALMVGEELNTDALRESDASRSSNAACLFPVVSGIAPGRPRHSPKACPLRYW